MDGKYHMMRKSYLIILLITVLWPGIATDAQNYKQESTYLSLRDSMTLHFNAGDSVGFFKAVKNLEDYLLKQNDLHAYYTQRCNEIVFLMNANKIYEAYKLARQMSYELRKRNLNKELYMAYNMQGHISRICGNKKAAKENFLEAIRLMEQEGYYENMPPVFMNIMNVEYSDDSKEAEDLMNRAREIAEKYAPERLFDIETRQTISYFSKGETDKFLEGYKAYQKGVEEGKNSIYGRSMELYYLAAQGKYDQAIAKALEQGNESDEIILLYEKAGRWEDAYHVLQKQVIAKDSIDNVVLTNSMQGIADELNLYEVERAANKKHMIGMTVIIILLLLLSAALFYIMHPRRKMMKKLKEAYKHALESDNMKTAFIQNISHEIRTPLNIISGFAQVIADPYLTDSVEERQKMAKMMQGNANQIIKFIDEILGLSLIEATEKTLKEDEVKINSALRDMAQEYQSTIQDKIIMRVDTALSNDFTLTTNKNMFKRIIAAILDNAVNNTEEGTICIKALKDAEMLLIAIEDTGCGVPEAEAEHIFERFVKLDSFKEGIGLGLPLSRKLAQQLGGTIKLDTRYKDGARFTIELPIH